MQLSQKESELLKDLKGQEQLCIDKYKKHASCASDVQLKGLLNKLAGVEQKHLDMLTQIEQGTVPAPGNGNSMQSSFTATYGTVNNANKQNDMYICTDLLTTEKHASHLYDTCVFEFKDQNVRDVLNSIQSDEQNHGKMLYDYMEVNQMYA